MKKFFSFVVIAAMCVSMVGCGGDAAKDKDKEKKPDAPAPSAPSDTPKADTPKADAPK